MKKTLVLLLILAVAGGLFAQELTFSGDVKTGLVFRQNGSEDPTLGFWHDDAGPVRVNLTGTYDNENHGAWFTLLFKPQYNFNQIPGGTVDSNLGNVAIDSGGVWGELLNDMVKFTVGVTGSKWGTGGKLDVSSGDSNLAVEIKPIPGLNFGFNLGDRSWLSGAGAGYGFSSIYTAEKMAKTFGGGVKYESGFIDIFAGGRVGTVEISDDNKAYLDVYVKPLGDPLKIEVGAKALSLGKFDDENNNARIIGTLFATYKTDADNAGSLTAQGGGLIAYNMGKDAAIGWKGIAGVWYQMSDPLKLGLEGNIQSSGKNVDKDYDVYLNKNADTALKIEVTPNVTFKLADNADVYFYYRLNVHAYDDDNLEHKVQLNFNWSF